MDGGLDCSRHPGQHFADIRRGWWKVEKRSSSSVAAVLWICNCWLFCDPHILHITLLEGGKGGYIYLFIYSAFDTGLFSDNWIGLSWIRICLPCSVVSGVDCLC